MTTILMFAAGELAEELGFRYRTAQLRGAGRRLYRLTKDLVENVRKRDALPSTSETSERAIAQVFKSDEFQVANQATIAVKIRLYVRRRRS